MHHLCAYKRGCLFKKNSSKTTKKRIGQALKVTITKTKTCSPHSLETTEWKTGIFATITAMQKTQAREGEAESSTDAPSGPGRSSGPGGGRTRGGWVAAAHLAGFGQAVLLLPQLPAGRVQALLAQPVALQLLLHLLLRLGLPLLQLPNARQELLVAVHLALPRGRAGERESEQGEPTPPAPPSGQD